MMPVGISFENSSLKNSFSLSSLQQTPSETTPDHRAVKQRQFNSLTKNRVKATAIRRSWGSTASDQREEFWSVLQANYNFIMDNNLIDKCQEVNGDLSRHGHGTWTLKEFYAQFSELYSWLNSVQETIYGKEENITDKSLRASCVNKVLERSPSLKLFNDQASQLVQLYPEVQEEVGWRTTHLNSKWDSILSILGPSDCEMCDQDKCLDIDHELKCLRSWFKIMESCLQPLDFRAKYTKTEIETKALELNVLHRDIENHGKIVGSVVKLCKRPDAKCNTINARRIANGLERRWHLLFLRSLEWQCYLESLTKRQNFRNSTSSSDDESDSDCYKEPASKYPRLSNRSHFNRNSNRNQKIEQGCDSNEDDAKSSVLLESNEIVMNDTVENKLELMNGDDVVDGKSIISSSEKIVDTSQFTQSNKKLPNLATYYFKHEDTDSDMERIENFSLGNKTTITTTDGQTSTLDETSEEEWTYIRNADNVAAVVPVNNLKLKNDRIDDHDDDDDDDDNNVEEEEQIVPKSKTISDYEIRMLVQKAEELVSPEKFRKTERSGSLKMSRIITKRLNNIDRRSDDDSCDASAEEDEEKESQNSEELDNSTMTLQGDSQNISSYPELNNTWYGSSCNTQFRINRNISKGNFKSNSESALHRINFSPKILHRSTILSTNSFSANGNQSTSSTVEEIPSLATDEVVSPIRRKKSKKKKCLFVKSDPHLLNSPQRSQRNLLIKSGSFSGYSLHKSGTDRNSASDPSAVHYYTINNKNCCEISTTTSGADSEDDDLLRTKRLPNCNNKNGLKQRHTTKLSESRDKSPSKFSLNATESSSSEAWDNYQENYNLSEPYSESHDSDAARRLLNFGEDYRNFIDSQSDWSALSDMSPKFRRKTLVQEQITVEEPNSDEESLKKLLNNSRDQLKAAQDVFDHLQKDGITNNVTNEIEDLMLNCDSHIALLSHITESSDEYKMTLGDKAVTAGLLNQWRQLKMRNNNMEECNALQAELAGLAIFMEYLEPTILRKNGNNNNLDGKSSTEQQPQQPQQQQEHPEIISSNSYDVENLKETLEIIKTKLEKLSTIKESINRLILDGSRHHKYFCENLLNPELLKMYRLYNNARTSIQTKLSKLEENVVPAWKILETRLEQLQKDLKDDGETLHHLDNVVRNGQFTGETATRVRDVAKVLAETSAFHPHHQGCYPRPRSSELFTESSFSDSGMSDEGSEHEIGERQGRLAALKRLVRQLETNFGPESVAVRKMGEKLRLAEQELKDLQERCKELILRTANISQEQRTLERLTQIKEDSNGLIIINKTDDCNIISDGSSDNNNAMALDDAKPNNNNNNNNNNNWCKKFFKVSLAFQFVLLIFVGWIYWYQPECCDYMNNSQWPISPKWRYDGQPPM